MVLAFRILNGIRWILVVIQNIIIFLILFYLWMYVNYAIILGECIFICCVYVLVVRLMSTQTFLNEILDYFLLRCFIWLEYFFNLFHFGRNCFQVILNLFPNINDHSVHLNDLIIDERSNIKEIYFYNSNFSSDFF